MSDLRRIYGKLSYEVQAASSSRRARRSTFDGYRIGAYRGRAPARRRSATRCVEDDRPGRFDPDARTRARRARRARCSGACSAGRPSRPAGAWSRRSDVMGEPRPGRKLVFTGDTEPCEATVAVAHGAELLVHDGTFADEELERARQTGHSTARQAAEVARAAGVALLALTHLSSRYFAPAIEKEAREVFERTVVPRDFDVIEVPYPERGGARAA